MPVEFGAQGRILHLGESVAFRMTNTTDTDLDVTLLLVDADYQNPFRSFPCGAMRTIGSIVERTRPRHSTSRDRLAPSRSS